MVTVLTIIADQGSKIFVAKRMELGQSIPVLGNFFRITFIRNAGSAFGIFLGGGWFYLLASILAIILIFFYLRKMSAGHLWSRISLTLILGGALGNLIDRVRYGMVIDFLDFGVGRLRWPVFNLADAAVTVGVAVFLLLMFQKKAEDRGQDKKAGCSQSD
ncbi:signal peptidase II [bacterium]|nr:signal peptidase II [bacterium]